MKTFYQIFIENCAQDIKIAVQSAKEISKNANDPKAIELYRELISQITSKPYPEAIEYIDGIAKDPKLKFLLSLGFGGDFSNLKLKITKKNIPAYRLVPTQNEIDLDQSLKYLLSGKNIEHCFKDPAIIKKPVVTFQGTFIIDGHHRWSEIFITNPQAKLECVNIEGNLSPLSMLKAVQSTIASNLGKVVSQTVDGKSLYNVSEKVISQYIMKNISKECIIKLQKYYNNPQAALLKNCMELKANNTPILDAPKRDNMPQTGKDPDLFGDLKKGVTKI